MTSFAPNALGFWGLGITYIEEERMLVIHLVAWTFVWQRA